MRTPDPWTWDQAVLAALTLGLIVATLALTGTVR